jgi:hypothetical protein
MRQQRRPRFKKRSAVVLAVAMAGTFGVGLIAYPASAAAAPPVVPTCTPKPTTNSDSCVTLKVAAADGSIGTAFENVRLGVRTTSVFDSDSDEVSTLTLRFDDKIEFNLAGIPVCFPGEVSGKTIAQAWEQCGPGADGTPASEGNAYLSGTANVSGIAHVAPPFNFSACALVFRGPNWDPPPAGAPLFPTLTLYFRATVSSPTSCNNPATNTAGTQTFLAQGFLSTIAAPYKWQLTIPNVDTVPFGARLDDYYVTASRGGAFRARCPTPTYKHKLVGIFDYTLTPTDTIAPPYPGTTDTCP